MAIADFATSAEYYADAERRAYDLLNGQIARIDAALDFLKSNRSRVLPSIYDGLCTQLVGHRNMAEWYLLQPGFSTIAPVAIGMMGANGRGPRLDMLIESVDFHVNKATDYRALRDANNRRVA